MQTKYISLESVSSLDHDQNKITGLRELGSRRSTGSCHLGQMTNSAGGMRLTHGLCLQFYEADKGGRGPISGCVIFPYEFKNILGEGG
jgi:hypothetical protein